MDTGFKAAGKIVGFLEIFPPNPPPNKNPTTPSLVGGPLKRGTWARGGKAQTLLHPNLTETQAHTHVGEKNPTFSSWEQRALEWAFFYSLSSQKNKEFWSVLMFLLLWWKFEQTFYFFWDPLGRAGNKNLQNHRVQRYSGKSLLSNQNNKISPFFETPTRAHTHVPCFSIKGVYFAKKKGGALERKTKKKVSKKRLHVKPPTLGTWGTFDAFFVFFLPFFPFTGPSYQKKKDVRGLSKRNHSHSRSNDSVFFPNLFCRRKVSGNYWTKATGTKRSSGIQMEHFFP